MLRIEVRPVESTDVNSIAGLNAQLGFPANQVALVGRLGLIRKYPSHILLVAEVEGATVGWIHAYEAPSLLSDATVEIGGLVVEKEMRRNGVGKALMLSVEKWAKDRGFKEILLATRIDRKDAQDFYKAIGYEFVHTTHFLSKDLAKD